MVTNKETKPFGDVKNIPELIAFIDKYLISISEKIDGKDFKDNIFELKKNSKGKPLSKNLKLDPKQRARAKMSQGKKGGKRSGKK